MNQFPLASPAPPWPLLDLAAPAPAAGQIESLQAGIRRRFLEEFDRLHAGGFVASVAAATRHIGCGPNTINELRQGRRLARLSHIRRLKDVYNADYHYVLFGVEEPDPVRRGAYRTAQSGPPRKSLLAEIDDWMAYRFVKEVERMAREGRVRSKLWFSQLLGAHVNTINDFRSGTGTVQAHWIPMLKEHLNADFHFIMWGYERPDISLPVKVVNGQRIRLDVFPRRPLVHPPTKPKWGPYIPERREDDETKRHEAGYYMDLKSLSEK